MGICISDCLENEEFPTIDLCDLEKGRVEGYEDPFAFGCGFAFDNILDPQEWKAGIESGGILKFPCGSFIQGDASQDETNRHCDKISYDITKYPSAEYSSGWVWKDDECYWATIEKKQCFGQFDSFGFKRCAGDNIVLPSAVINKMKAGLNGTGAIPVSKPGFTLNMKTPEFKPVNGAGGYGRWMVPMEFSNSGVLISIESAEICAIIKSTNYIVPTP